MWCLFLLTVLANKAWHYSFTKEVPAHQTHVDINSSIISKIVLVLYQWHAQVTTKVLHNDLAESADEICLQSIAIFFFHKTALSGSTSIADTDMIEIESIKITSM